jgi:protein-disulfide isomerase
MRYRVSRRRLLAAGGTAAVIGLAGCSDGGTGDDPDAESDGGSDDGGSSVTPASIDDDTRPALGVEDAPVTMAVFQDFSCPHCRSFKREVAPTIVADYVDPGDVRYLHADFPIPVDEQWSYAIANAARAVFEEAGNDAFWPFSEEIYAHQGDYSLDVVESVADEIADVGTAAREAAESGAYRDRIDADRELGIQWGVEGTPAIFVGDELVAPNEVAETIESRLQ